MMAYNTATTEVLLQTGLEYGASHQPNIGKLVILQNATATARDKSLSKLPRKN